MPLSTLVENLLLASWPTSSWSLLALAAAVTITVIMLETRLSLIALGVAMLLSGVAFHLAGDGALLLTKLSIGLLAWLIIALGYGKRWSARVDWSVRWPLIIGMLLVAIAAIQIGLSERTLFGLRAGWQLVALFLAGGGLCLALFSQHSAEAGMGLLLFLRGAEFVLLDRGQTSSGLLVTAGLMLAVALATVYWLQEPVSTPALSRSEVRPNR